MFAVRFAVSFCLAFLLALTHVPSAQASNPPILLAQAQADRPNLFRSLFGIGRRKKLRQEAGPMRRQLRAVQPKRQTMRRKPPVRRNERARVEQASVQSSREHRPARRRVGKRRSERAVAAAPASGTFRTLCVRTCDGYYFPISFSTTRDRFANDQMACEAMCPGAEAALYYHDTKLSVAPDADAAVTMMSLKEEPYTALPAAFSYRLRLDKSCTCGRPGALQLAAVGDTTEAEEAIESFNGQSGLVPLPIPRPDPKGSLETLVGREGNVAASGSSPQALVSTANAPSNRPVRVIWPAYGKDSDKAFALLRPVSQ